MMNAIPVVALNLHFLRVPCTIAREGIPCFMRNSLSWQELWQFRRFPGP